MFIDISDIKKSYGAGENRVEVLKGISFGVEKGEFCVLLGPSGSGKSTLLKALCRLLEPASGAVYLDSKDINKMSTEEVARTLAVMAQSANAPGGTTVEELVCYGRMPYRRFFDGLNQEDRLAIEEALEFMSWDRCVRAWCIP